VLGIVYVPDHVFVLGIVAIEVVGDRLAVTVPPLGFGPVAVTARAYPFDDGTVIVITSPGFTVVFDEVGLPTVIVLAISKIISDVTVRVVA